MGKELPGCTEVLREMGVPGQPQSQCRWPSFYLISQQSLAKLQVVSFQDGGPMELGQRVLGSEWERKRETPRESQHGMPKTKVKDINQSCHLLILSAERLKSWNGKELVTQ